MRYLGMYEDLIPIRFERVVKRGMSLRELFNNFPLIKGYNIGSEEELEILTSIKNGKTVRLDYLTVTGIIKDEFFYGSILEAIVDKDGSNTGIYMNSGLIPLISAKLLSERTSIPLPYINRIYMEDYLTHLESGEVVKAWELEYWKVNKAILQIFSLVERLAWNSIPF